MNIKILKIIFIFLMLGLGAEVQAAGIISTCEVRYSYPRSKVVIKGSGFVGRYYASIYSGGVWKSSPLKWANSTGQIEFKFDSNLSEVGATVIPANYIQGGKVLSLIRRYDQLLMGSVLSLCKVS